MDLQNIIIKPIITEKSMDNVAKNKFTFMVLKDANKKQIKNAIEKKFNVKVKSLATNIVKGRSTRVGRRRQEVVKSPWKKAIAELEAGQKIDLFDVGKK